MTLRFQLTAHHHFHQLVRGNFRHLTGADDLAVTHNRHGFADLKDLLHTVRNIYDSDALALQIADDLEQRIQFFFG